jgi:hypothetical protein
MDWFRTKREAVAWLALLALTCQFVLSFGHVHAARLGSTAVTNIGDAAAGAPPPHKNPAGPADDFCAVCASISLAGTLVLPVLAAVIAVSLSGGMLRSPWAPREPSPFDFIQINSRGPPRS